MTAQEMWELYKSKVNAKHDKYEAWCYGSDDPNALAKLTLEGIKTATASAYPLYKYENCPIPEVGGYNIILDTDNNAVCITQTIKVSVIPFNQVSEEHAYKEGEGDRTLEFWRQVHRDFFTEELKEINATFDEDMLVVCEVFEVVYPVDEEKK